MLHDRVLLFKKCLQYTLYRPRDLLVLLNNSYIIASRSGRNEIIGDDIEKSSISISKDRLNDLMKEYDQIFPGLKLFVEIFYGRAGVSNLEDTIALIDEKIKTHDYSSQISSDFAILDTGRNALFALYSIGFIGIEDSASGKYSFCHDGATSNLDPKNNGKKTCIHPCYWKALNIQPDKFEEGILHEIYDDYQIKENPDVKDIRTKQIGQLITTLPQMPTGEEGASEFEDWIFRAIKILFSGNLSNPELKPNKDAIQRRDIVATIMAKEGFWRRVFEDYKCRQVVFEIKNYSELKPEDYRQVLSYTSEQYGKFAIIVNRSETEGLSDSAKGWIKEIWDQHKVLILVIPAKILSRCISKLRSIKRFNYSEDCLNKRLDTFTRSYLSLHHINSKKKK